MKSSSTSMKMSKLFRVWLGWSDIGGGDRREAMRILARNLEQAIKFARDEMVVPEYHEQLEEMEFGWMWDEQPDECNCEDPEEHECYTTYYIEVEELEEYSAEDLSFRLISGENLYYDITEE